MIKVSLTRSSVLRNTFCVVSSLQTKYGLGALSSSACAEHEGNLKCTEPQSRPARFLH